MSGDHRIGMRQPGWPQGLILAAQAIRPTMGPMLLVPAVPLLLAAFKDVPEAEYWVPALLTAPALCIARLVIPAGAPGELFGRRTTLMAALAPSRCSAQARWQRRR